MRLQVGWALQGIGQVHSDIVGEDAVPQGNDILIREPAHVPQHNDGPPRLVKLDHADNFAHSAARDRVVVAQGAVHIHRPEMSI